MRYSLLFGKTKRTVPAEAVSSNHRLLVQGGFVDQLSAGVFTWMPLGLRVLRKIDEIIREEMDTIGGQEVTMPALIQKGNWEKTGRWNNVDILFKTKSQTGKEYGLGFSHEEVVSPLAAQYIRSYKDLPLYLYQIQTKFRDELRAKSGLLRGREFGMKDLYSFHTTAGDLHSFYAKVKQAYLTVFSRCGLNQIKITEASGGTFTKKHSHEFNVLTPAGEIELLYCEHCTFAQNVDITRHKKGDTCPTCAQGKLVNGKAIEVGNIFDLGAKFAQDFGVMFTDSDGTKKPVVMGCYGIGDTRLVGTIVELYHDAQGILWPQSVAPFDVHLVGLGLQKAAVKKNAQDVYQKLRERGVEVLFDDRIETAAGEKFADCDLIGIPWRLVVSQKTGAKVELKRRKEKNSTIVELPLVLEKLANNRR